MGREPLYDAHAVLLVGIDVQRVLRNDLYEVRELRTR